MLEQLKFQFDADGLQEDLQLIDEQIRIRGVRSLPLKVLAAYLQGMQAVIEDALDDLSDAIGRVQNEANKAEWREWTATAKRRG